jgi:DNA-binding NtrC family response regulator
MATTVHSTAVLEFRGGRIEDVESGTSVVVGSEPVVIGRDPACGLVVARSGISAVHAELTATPTGVRLHDLGSKNGTWVGDLRVYEALLTTSTTFWVGQTELRFEVVKPLRVNLPGTDRLGAMYGSSDAMRDVFRRVKESAPTDLTVLIHGETGTGKELVAQAIHAGSARKGGPFVVLDCGAIAPSLAEAALFGHEKGAFTGASSMRESPFLEANGGTIFLDEIGELPLEAQPKLLRALAERRVKRVGGSKYLPFDARVVAATRRSLEADVNQGTFRSDLYFRLAQVHVRVPPLRDRPDDLGGLVRTILETLGAKGAWRRVSRASIRRLLGYDWPGNVRELHNAVSVALALAGEREPLEIAECVGLKAAKPKLSAASLGTDNGYHEAKRKALHQFERAYFAQLVTVADGNVAEISRRSGLQRTHVRKYLRLHGLREPRPR